MGEFGEVRNSGDTILVIYKYVLCPQITITKRYLTGIVSPDYGGDGDDINMKVIKNQAIIYSFLLIGLVGQFAYGESNSGDFYFSNVKDLFLKEEQTISPTLSVSSKDTTGLQRAYNHCSLLKFYYIAIPEFDSASYELLKFSYKSDKVPFLAFGAAAYERIGRLTAKDHPYIYSVLPLSVYIDFKPSDYIPDYFCVFLKFSNWGQYSNPDSIRTSYFSYGVAIGNGLIDMMQLGVLHINNNHLKDDFYYISIGFDIGAMMLMGGHHTW